MLAELAAINAGFAIFKQTVQNGGQIMSIGSTLKDLIFQKEKLEQQVEEGKKTGQDMSEQFWALEEFKVREQEINEEIIYYGRPGLWQDWVRFKKQQEANQEESDNQRLKRIRANRAKREQDRKEIQFMLKLFGGFVFAIAAVLANYIIFFK